MKKYILLICFAFTLTLTLTAQKKKKNKDKELTGQEAADLVESLNFNSSSFLANAGNNACQCIDSVDKLNQDKPQKLEGFSNCIDAQVTSFQLSVKLLDAMKSGKKDNNINLNTDKNSAEYKIDYYKIERWVKDSCKVLNHAILSNDEAGEKSISDNKEARAAYTKGLEFLRVENYAEAIPWFEKAVSIDPQFAFAWDNLGISYRKINNLDKALAAYQSSLKVDPHGRTPLQNLPIVYIKQEKYTAAIAAYINFLSYYPDDPEVYYGLSLIYVNNTPDMEKALSYMCKAYNIYVKQKSPFRSDSENVINIIYKQMKKENKEEAFNRILAENNIKSH